jgi:hypothetical protein
MIRVLFLRRTTMSDKSLETNFLYDVGDFVTYNYPRNDDEVIDYAVIVSRKIIGSNRAYKVIWLDNLIGYVAKEYEYLENQIKKAENNE